MNTKKVEYLIETIAFASEIYSESDSTICDFYYEDPIIGDPKNSVFSLNINDKMIKITEGNLDKSIVSKDYITFVDSNDKKWLTISLSEHKPMKIKSNWKN